jgi:hypothetical protein
MRVWLLSAQEQVRLADERVNVMATENMALEAQARELRVCCPEASRTVSCPESRV